MMTRTQLRTKILTNLGNRTDLTAEASAAISNAITYYNRERFYFLEEVATMPLTSSQAWYVTPSDLGGAMDVLGVTINGSKGPMIRTHYAALDEKDDGKTFGEPSEWAYYKDNLRLYPVPNSSYVITLSYHKTIDDPSVSGSNVWTGIASQLIEQRASWDMWSNVLRSDADAQRFKGNEMEIYMSMIGETTRKISTGRLKKSGW